MTLHWFQCETARLAGGWSGPLRIGVDSQGTIAAISDEPGEPAEVLAGAVLPGMANLHSHAFQRAIAGLTERRTAPGEDFWSWRAAMYRFALRLEPEDVGDIAAFAYLEMLRAGYTSVCEFHYLHSGRDGRAYREDAMAAALIDAAARAGIALTLIPTLYRTSGFAEPPLAEQRRFIQTPELFLERLAALDALAGPQLSIGVGFHSLRAVPAADIDFVLSRIGADRVVHIHVAEQIAEVDACREYTGQTPVAWLLDHCPVGAHWALVHATHMNETELSGLARSGATAVLCPSTEGNLADGRFAFDAYRAAGGAFGIGSDSQVALDPSEELRWLDYLTRLARGTRMSDNGAAHRGADLWLAAAASKASGRLSGTIAVGQKADWIVLDTRAAAFAGRSGDELIDTFVFGARPGMIRDVVVGGNLVQRAHDIEARYARTIAKLTQDQP